MSETPNGAEGRHILVCYDGSRESERALDRAAEIASLTPSRVTIVSVAEPIYRNPPYTGYADPSEEQAHRELLDHAVQTLAAQGISADTLEPAGDTVEEIITAARELDADLVIAGSRHRGLAERLVRGSVSGRLLVDAPADVLIVR
ncbi:MAG TPA: universal stress protein [Gaiellaceae bacterium]|nr:universal stress protein [Gaiellaceae bacterium]